MILAVVLASFAYADLVPTTDCTVYFLEHDSQDLVYDNNVAYIPVRNEDCSPVNTGFKVMAYQREEFFAKLDKRVPQQETVIFKFEDLPAGVYNFRLYFYTSEREVLKDVIQGVNVAYCGDGVCGNQKEGEQEENCYLCPSDCACPSYELCDEGDQMCKHFCGNGIKEYNETCRDCPADAGCEKGYFCSNATCVNYCGNGMCESLHGEDCWTCKEDCPCNGATACNVNDQTVYWYVDSMDVPLGFRAECVSINTNSNCGSVGNVCEDGEFCHDKQCVQCVVNDDCKTFTVVAPLEEYICINNNTAIQQKVVKKWFMCDWGDCVGEEVFYNATFDCNGELCQNGACGCEPGYQECFAAGECRRKGLVDVGNDCVCDFECDSQMCYNRSCALVLDESDVEKAIEKYGRENVHLVFTENNQTLLVEELPQEKKKMGWLEEQWRDIAGYSLLVLAVILIIILGNRLFRGRGRKRQQKRKTWKGDYY